MKKPELLSPAGNMRCLKAAIEAGCDAIYLGGKHFGARQFSNNFDEEEMIEAIKYAHRRNVKIYVTVNTLIYEYEIDALMEYVEFLHKNNVDALIVQDIGIADLIHQTFPNLELHASTQMHIHNLEGVKFAKKLGVKRVVLARETNIDLIKNIKENIDMDLEIFVHGALCMSYSGECLMSSLIGGRSGNRGTCSQCCRMPYDIVSNGKTISKDIYALSTKDLNTLDYIGLLMEANVDSLKIEGRMKSEYYVYTVTKLYRKAIDSYYENKKVYIDNELLNNLKTIFNREFTKGFIFGEDNDKFINHVRPNHMGVKIGETLSYNNGYVKIKLEDTLNRLDGIRILGNDDVGFIIEKMYIDKKEVETAHKGDIVSIKVKEKVDINQIVVKTKDKKINDEIDQLIDSESRKNKIKIKVKCLFNKEIVLEVIYKDKTFKLYGDKVEKSINASMKKEDIIKRLSKLGGTPYEISSYEIEADDDIFIRINTLNELKRKMVEELDKIMIYQIPYKKENYNRNPKEFIENKGFSLYVKNMNDYNEIKNKNVKNIYLEEPLYSNINDDRKTKKLLRVKEEHLDELDNLLVGELGSINKYENVISDYSLNITNSYSVAYLHSLGVKRITLSYELNEYQIEKLINNYQDRYKSKSNLELIVSSIPDAMITKFDFISYHKQNNDIYLKDKMNNLFKIEKKDKFNNISFYKKIELEDYNKYFDMGINTLRIHIEDQKDIQKLV